MEETGRKDIISDDTQAMTEKSVDVGALRIDPAFPYEEKKAALMKEGKHPYCMQIGDVMVESVFLSGERSIQDCVKEYLLHIKEQG